MSLNEGPSFSSELTLANKPQRREDDWFYRLSQAIWKNDIESVKQLAPPGTKVRGGFGNVWHLAMALGRSEIVRYFAASEAYLYRDDLLRCIERGDLQSLQALISDRDLSRSMFESGRTLVSEILQCAIQCGQPNIFAYFLDFAVAVDINEELSQGRGTLLHQAAQHDSVTVAEMLVKAGADVNRMDGNRLFALHIAAKHGSEEVFNFLFSCSAHEEKSESDHHRSTLLDAAFQGRNMPVARILMMQHQADPSNPRSHYDKMLQQAFYNEMLQRAFLNGDMAFVHRLKGHGRQFGNASFTKAMQTLIHPARLSLMSALHLQSLDGSHKDFPRESSVTKNLAIRWFRQCLSTHGLCMLEEALPNLPKRVLEIRGTTCRLIKSDNRRDYYATLSHRWDAEDMYRTTKSNLEVHENGVDVSKLSNSIQVGIELAKFLGLKYLWVDALCIVQDSRTEVSTEISKMADIYGKSCLTIAIIDPELPTDGQSNITHPSLARRPRGVLDTRAWPLQEQILSRRVLNCTRSGPYWDCLTHNASPVHITGTPVSLDRDFGDRDLQVLKEGIHLSRLISVNAAVADYLQVSWHRVVEDYSRRELKEATDRALAIVGVAGKISSVTGHTYFTGVWKEGILQDLCWLRGGTPQELYSRAISTYTFQAPTWSWLSIPFPVRYYSTDRLNRKSSRLRSEREQYVKEINFESPSNSFGEQLIRLRLCGLLQNLNKVLKDTWNHWKELKHGSLPLRHPDPLLDTTMQNPDLSPATTRQSGSSPRATTMQFWKSFLPSLPSAEKRYLEDLLYYDSDERPSANSKSFWTLGMTVSLILEPVDSEVVSTPDGIIKYRRIGVLLKADYPTFPSDNAYTVIDLI